VIEHTRTKVGVPLEMCGSGLSGMGPQDIVHHIRSLMTYAGPLQVNLNSSPCTTSDVSNQIVRRSNIFNRPDSMNVYSALWFLRSPSSKLLEYAQGYYSISIQQLVPAAIAKSQTEDFL